MVLPASDRVSRAPPYSRTTPQDRLILLTGLSPSMVRLSSRLLLSIGLVTCVQRFGSETVVVQPRSCNARTLAHERFRLVPSSLATTTGISFDVFSSGYLDVSVHRVRSLTTIEFIVESMPMTAWGLPHSEIAGSSLLSSSPTLIAALHVLHRLWNQGIHLHALIYFRLRKIAPTHSG
jgi:hypothetical protein